MASLSATHIAPAGGGYEPQRRYNYFLYLNGVAGAEQIRLSTVGAFLPADENDVITMRFGNEEVYVAGGAKPTAGSIRVRDFIDKDIYTLLRAWRQTVYDALTGNIGLAAVYKKTARLVLTAPDNSTVRQFQLLGLWPTKITPGELSYDNATAIVEITMDVRYDRSLPV